MKFVLILVALFASACTKYHIVKPDGDRSRTDYFVSTTDSVSKAANLPILRNIPIDDDLTEIRIWVGFGPLVIQDMYRIYKLDNGKLEGEYIWYFDVPNDKWEPDEKKEFYTDTYEYCDKINVFEETESCKVMLDHNTDWNEIYNKLNKLDIWNMPDNSEIPEYKKNSTIVTLDGSSIVVELKKKGYYRSFSHRLSPAPIKKKYRYGSKIMDILIEEIK